MLVLGTNAGRGLYHRVLEACARAEDWQAVSLLVKEMEEDKDLPLDADSYLALMDGSTHAKNLSRLQRYANKMRDAVRTTDTNTTHITPHQREGGESLVQIKGRSADVLCVFVQGLLFGLGHYASLVHTYTSFGKYGLALSTYRQAQDAGGKTPLYCMRHDIFTHNKGSPLRNEAVV